METNLITKKIIGCAIEVHKQLGSGILESTYEECPLNSVHLRALCGKKTHHREHREPQRKENKLYFVNYTRL